MGHLCPRHGRCSPWLSIFSIDQETLFLYRNEESFVIFVFCFHHDQNGDLHPSHLKETLLWTWTPSCWLNLGGWSELTINTQKLVAFYHILSSASVNESIYKWSGHKSSTFSTRGWPWWLIVWVPLPSPSLSISMMVRSTTLVSFWNRNDSSNNLSASQCW